MLRDSHVVAFTTCITTIRRKCKETWDQCVIDMPQMFIIIVFLQKKLIIDVPFSLKIEHKIKRGSFSKARWVAQKLLSKLRKTCYASTHTNTTVGSRVQERQSCYLWQQISPLRCGSSVIKTLLNDAQVGFKIPSLPFLAYISVRWLRRLFMGFCPII